MAISIFRIFVVFFEPAASHPNQFQAPFCQVDEDQEFVSTGVDSCQSDEARCSSWQKDRLTRQGAVREVLCCPDVKGQRMRECLISLGTMKKLRKCLELPKGKPWHLVIGYARWVSLGYEYALLTYRTTWRDDFSYHASGTIPTSNPHKSTNIAQNVFKQRAISSASSEWARNGPFSFHRQGSELSWCYKVNCSPLTRRMTLYRSYWS